MKKLLTSAFLLLFISSTVSAQNIATKYVSGEQVKKNTEKVMSKIQWINDLDELKAEAQKQNKLIFWMQIVGDLDSGL